MAVGAIIGGAMALYSIGKGIYDTIRADENAKKMQKILKAKQITAPQPVVQEPQQQQTVPSPQVPSNPISPSFIGTSPAMAPMPVKDNTPNPVELPGMPVPGMSVGQPITPPQDNPLTSMATASPTNVAFQPMPNPLENQQPKPMNPWQQYLPSNPWSRGGF